MRIHNPAFLSISFLFLTPHPLIIRRFSFLKLSADFFHYSQISRLLLFLVAVFLALVIRIFHFSFNSNIFFHIVDVTTIAYLSRSNALPIGGLPSDSLLLFCVMAFMSPSEPVPVPF
jgi:hypothetical protein